ncbi:hypothetical protein [Rhodococcoides kroppenstedtii]|uniref:hypothetical protein n=1 Tax=Rhodococcoides kroppenstedtii TaxID=293050 RepID=UPI0028E4EB18|nr:hypothetical protein [Rhodococcus kroppenstedtii]
MVGPGGAGKSTVAAALATGLRRRGARVVLTCLDGHDPATLLGTGADMPEAVRLDASGLVEERYRTLAALAAGGHDHGAGPSLPDAEELTGVPVAETVAALAEVVRLADRDDVDHVVVDGPSAGNGWTSSPHPRRWPVTSTGSGRSTRGWSRRRAAICGPRCWCRWWIGSPRR